MLATNQHLLPGPGKKSLTSPSTTDRPALWSLTGGLRRNPPCLTLELFVCESISSPPAAARLHKALARETIETRQAIKNPTGTYTANEKERALALLAAHFPDATPVTQEEPEEYRRSPSDWKVAKDLFTQRSVEWAVSSFDRYKSPGVDGISPVLLKQGGGLLLPHLVGIMRNSLALSYIPKMWTRSRVVFIPKIGRRDYSLAKSFRPISLTSFMLKTMEKVVDNEIRSNALKGSPLHPNQHGGGKSHGHCSVRSIYGGGGGL